jgi:hypothetical protein
VSAATTGGLTYMAVMAIYARWAIFADGRHRIPASLPFFIDADQVIGPQARDRMDGCGQPPQLFDIG